MIEVISAADDVAAFRITGDLIAEDYDVMIPVIEDRLRRHRRVGVLADLSGLGDITLDAIVRDIRYSWSKLGELDRFKRAAVITDRRWIKAATTTADAIMPQVEMRVFPHDQTAQALDWVSSLARPDPA